MSLKDKIMALIEPSIEESGFDLVELKLSQYKKGSGLRIFVDSDDGVSLDDCAMLSRKVDTVLEENNIFRNRYTIEVSSPGLDRPLKTEKEFRRRIGERIMVHFENKDIKPVEGELTGVDGLCIELTIDNEIQRLELSDIKMAKIIL